MTPSAFPARHHAESHVEQLLHGRPGAVAARTEIDHRPFRRGNALDQLVDLGRGGSGGPGRLQHQRVERRRPGYRHALDVDGDLDAHRPRRHRQGIGRGARQHAEGVVRRTHAVGRLADAAQHAELIERLVHRAHPAVCEFAVRVPREVQQRRARRDGLEQPADRVGGAGAGAGDANAQLAGRPRIGVGHVRCAHLAARRHETHRVALADAVEHGQVVHRADAEHGRYADSGDELGDQVGHGVVVSHGRRSPLPGRLFPSRSLRQEPRAYARRDRGDFATATRRRPHARACPTSGSGCPNRPGIRPR
jgi:hypothetical protein